MGIYVYCVVPARHQLRTGSGIDGAPVTLTPFHALAAVTSVLEGNPEPTVERIRQHNQVVLGAVTPAVTPVPVRFGQWFESEATLREGFERRAAEFDKLLQDFAGALEYGVRVLDPAAAQALPPEPAAVRSGKEYLTAIQERIKAQQPLLAVQQRITVACAPYVRAERVDRPQAAAGMVSLAHLVEEAQAESYRECLRELRESLPDLRFLLSGPWPPYSFAS